LIALLWVLSLGQASFAGNPAGLEAGAPHESSVQPVTPSGVHSNFFLRATRYGNYSTFRLRKCLHAFPKVALSNDPYDDAASDDPNDDDDAWDDLNGYDDTGVSSIAWLREAVPYLRAPERAPVTWTAYPSSPPFLTLLRLRC
jgi:hypothetical protein